jgi:hypothetical protein
MPAVHETNETKLPLGEIVLPQVPHKLHRSVKYWNQDLTVDKTPESPNDRGGALVACGLWLHIGLIGAIALAAGLLQCFEDPRLPWAPAVALFGGVLAAASWRRGFAVLEQAERAPTVTNVGSSDSSLNNPPADRTRRESPAVSWPTSIERWGR